MYVVVRALSHCPIDRSRWRQGPCMWVRREQTLLCSLPPETHPPLAHGRFFLLFFVPVLVPVRACPVPSVVRERFKFLLFGHRI